MELQRPVVAPVVAEQPATPLAKTDVQPLSFEGFVEAVSTGKMSAEAVEKLTDVFLKVQAARAEQEYNRAFAEFLRECPSIPRNRIRRWKSATDKGVGFTTYYANAEDIMRAIEPCLLKHGFSISFDDQELKPNILVEHCRCSHVGGHSRSAPCHMPLESSSPAMSAQDKFDAASTRAKCGALRKILGLWTAQSSTSDGADEPPPPAPSPLLTEQQRGHIADLAGAVNQDWDDLLKWWGVPNFADATQDKYKAAVKFLEQKKQQQTKGTA